MEMNNLPEVKEIVSWPKRCLQWAFAEIRWVARALLGAFDRFYWDNGFSKAASLAYTTLFSLVPVTALGLGLLSSMAVKEDNLPKVREFIFRQFVPSIQAADTVLDQVSRFSADIFTLNELVIIFLVFTALILINSIEYVLNEIWQVFEARSVGHRIGIFCTIVVLAPVLAVSAYYTAAAARPELFFAGIDDSLLRQKAYDYFNWAHKFLLPFFIDFLAFVFLYYLVPKAPVMLRSACFGAFVAASFFGLAKSGFAYYVVKFPTYQTIYGALAAIPLFLFWVYLAWSIVLFGAECCYQAQHLPRSGKAWKRSVLSIGDGQMLLAVQSLAMICKAFFAGERLPNELEIAERLGCSSVVLKPTLAALERADIVVRGDSRNMPISLLRSPEKITLGEIRDAVFKSPTSMQFAREIQSAFAYFESDQDPSTVTLDQVFERFHKEAGVEETR